MVLGDVPGSDLVVLAVSELAGNAIVHTASGEPGGQFVVHLAAFADRWQVRVDDEGSPTDPRIVVADTGEGGETDWGAEAGRGLAMVNAVSRKWGVLGDHYARAVWAEIPYAEQNGTAVRSGMSGNMLDGLEAAADALAAEDDEDQDSGGRADGDTPGPEGEREAAADTPAEPAEPAPAEPAEPAEPVEPAEPPAPRVPAPQWPGRVPYDPKLAERHRRAAPSAGFMRALPDPPHPGPIGPAPPPA